MAIQAVLFDAVGTLIVPHPPVADVYHAHGLRFGSALTCDEIATRFRAAYRAAFSANESQQYLASEALDRQRWQRVVGQVFVELTEPARADLFAALWQHFAEACHWHVCDDAATAFRALRTRSHRVGIASNFDDRLSGILQGHDLLPSPDLLFVSTSIGYAKPDARFYETVQRRSNLPPEAILLVGDDYENDIRAPTAAGWQTCFIDRRDSVRATEHSLAQLVRRITG